MVIYADSLVFTNCVVDYVLLLITGLITKRTYKPLRLIISAVIGGFSSLYILVENTIVIVDIIFKLVSGFAVILVLQNYRKASQMILSFLVFTFLGFTLSGIAELVQTLTSDNVIFTDNLTNYLNISPLSLIIFTVIIYLFVKILRRITDKNTVYGNAILRLKLNGIDFEYSALIDTGHSLYDPFGDSQIFILDREIYDVVLASVTQKETERRKRIIPASTVGETVLLDGLRFDTAEVISGGKKFTFYNPVVARSENSLRSNTDAIVSHKVFSRISDR